MKSLLYVIYICAVLLGGSLAVVQAVPIAAVAEHKLETNEETAEPTVTVAAQPDDDLDPAGSEDNYVGQIPDQTAAAATNGFDPSIYAGLISPELFQQYASQFGASYAPYAAPYPAPAGYAPPGYPSPYAVQTGYEGYLVPTTAITTDSTTTAAPVTDLLAVLRSLIPGLMVSSLFRVVVTIVSAIGVLFFGGAITTAICRLTPICDISFKAVTYLRHSGTAERVGKMIVEDLTPERVRRASEFVWKAIHKYQQLQELVGE